jgi:large subunit ribosomal protein L23
MSLLKKLGIRKGKKEAEEKPLDHLARAEKPVRLAVSNAYRILIRPILSEKGTHLAPLGKYVFAVSPAANKSEIKKSIEQLYSVHVKTVRIVKMVGKRRRYGRTTGRTSDWKKAVITLRSGEKIPGIIEAVG